MSSVDSAGLHVWVHACVGARLLGERGCLFPTLAWSTAPTCLTSGGSCVNLLTTATLWSVSGFNLSSSSLRKLEVFFPEDVNQSINQQERTGSLWGVWKSTSLKCEPLRSSILSFHIVQAVLYTTVFQIFEGAVLSHLSISFRSILSPPLCYLLSSSESCVDVWIRTHQCLMGRGGDNRGSINVKYHGAVTFFVLKTVLSPIS